MASLITVQNVDGTPFDQRGVVSYQRFMKTLVKLTVAAGAYVTGGLTLDQRGG